MFTENYLFIVPIKVLVHNETFFINEARTEENPYFNWKNFNFPVRHDNNQ